MEEKPSERLPLTQQQMRKVAFVSIAISTAAVLCAIVTLPIMYSYVQQFHSHLILETEFCKSRARDIWSEMQSLQRHGMPSRARRQASFVGGTAPEGGLGGVESTFFHVNTFRFFCHKQILCTPFTLTNFLFIKAVAMTNRLAPHIPQAELGTGEQAMELLRELLPLSIVVLLAAIANKDLWDLQEKSGNPGREGNILASAIPPQDPCVICPMGTQGAVGMQGPTGPRGERGKNGERGIDGKPAEMGMIGPPGPPGQTGLPGPQGPKGTPGRLVATNGASGPAGEPGAKGAPGPKGYKGAPGQSFPGDEGDIGEPGNQGPPGNIGPIGPEEKRETADTVQSQELHQAISCRLHHLLLLVVVVRIQHEKISL
ncbi:hypothetical protein WR25_26730 [Diploscapter pachys]|uniref:Nematode cuticle collagen N-terminal domain-containing protein n=1 Tax=Diploscapter pachys TaxID=2018661 RepID=A0A2A2JL14_9BILA|nr:hypothetical protein WR25_26730 [Diploscapter pachys]